MNETAIKSIGIDSIINELQKAVDYMYETQSGYDYEKSFAREHYTHYFYFANALVKPFGFEFKVNNWKVTLTEKENR